MTEGLTDRQRELFQEDKSVLVNIITNLEEELEIERKCRVKAEQAHIKVQEEMDSKGNFKYYLNKKIKEHYKSIKNCEEGENGKL